MLFDWVVVGQVLPLNPASAVRGPTQVVKTGKTPCSTPAIGGGGSTPCLLTQCADRRDRVLIATLTYSFARISAALKMRVEDRRPRQTGLGAAAARKRR
jgi:hypothetical protein